MHVEMWGLAIIVQADRSLADVVGRHPDEVKGQRMNEPAAERSKGRRWASYPCQLAALSRTSRAADWPVLTATSMDGQPR